MEKLLKIVLFVLLSIVFLPCLLVVNLLNDTWSKLMGEALGL